MMIEMNAKETQAEKKNDNIVSNDPQTHFTK